MVSAMRHQTAYRNLDRPAEKWLELAERRRAHFRELYSSGLWRQYYSEEQFVVRLRDVARICDRWAMIVVQMRQQDRAPVLDEPKQRSAA